MDDAGSPLPLRLLRREHDLPTGLIPEDVELFLAWLGVPTLVFVKGRDASRSRVVATLLHGNEPSGVRAIHAWLRSERIPATDTLLLIAAVRTALEPPGFAHRFLPGRVDLNRCWLGPFESHAGIFAGFVLQHLRAAAPEALIDLHNNTGHNPPYGVGPDAGAAELRLAAFFADRFVVNNLRLGTLVEATRSACPSVSIECGRAGDEAADAIALAGLERFLAAEDLFDPIAPSDVVRVYEDPVRVRVRERIELAFGDSPVDGADFTVDRDIDRHNFEKLPPGVPIGWVARGAPWPVEARGEAGDDVSRQLFRRREGVLETRRSFVPIMMTANRRNALDDCLFYVVRARGD